uniref:Aminopeptidase n=1 Tax=Rhabditophanes sp. KR3021 TaxID=114890 RepID=A0AC35TH60_9BILA
MKLLTAVLYAVYLLYSVQASQPKLRTLKAEAFAKKHSLTKDLFSFDDSIYTAQLPRNVEVLDYTLSIKPYYPNDGAAPYPIEREFTFDGSSTCTLTLLQTVSYLDMHQLNLKMNQVSITDSNGIPQYLNYIHSDNTLQTIRIAPILGFQFNQTYTINFVYTGLIDDVQGMGLFRTSWLDPAGGTHYQISTQFEATSARQVFPCFDEPYFKSVFTVTLIYPVNMVALSNTAEVYPTYIDGFYQTITFPRTLKMSTYLVAFTIGKYTSRRAISANGVQIRSWAFPGMEDRLDFSVQTTSNCLTAMEAFVNEKYAYSKLDNVALTGFNAGAMENIGLMTYLQPLMLFNPLTDYTSVKLENSKVICHETAHQFYGDTVTTAWWNDIFLNEGFAEFFENFIQTKATPSEAAFFDSSIIQESQEGALMADEDANSHPLIVPNGASFDTITYSKGASLLYMIQGVVGPNNFQKGLQNYLSAHKFTAVTSEDLWTALSNATTLTDWCGQPLNISELMLPWTTQMGFPRIDVVFDSTKGYTISQTPYANYTQAVPSPFNYTWPVPLMIQTDTAKPTLYWLAPPDNNCQAPTKVVIPPTAKYVMANADSKSFVRINYDDASFYKLSDAVTASPNSFSINSKIRIMNDEWRPVQLKMYNNKPVDMFRVFSISRTILQNTAPNVNIYGSVSAVIRSMLNWGSTTFSKNLVVSYVKDIVSNMADQMSWLDQGSYDLDTLRKDLIWLSVKMNDQVNIQNGLNYFRQITTTCQHIYTSGCNPYPPDVRSSIYCAIAKQGTDPQFTTLLSYFTSFANSNYYDDNEVLSFAEGLMCAEDPVRIHNVFVAFMNYPILFKKAAKGLLLNKNGIEYINTFFADTLSQTPTDDQFNYYLTLFSDFYNTDALVTSLLITMNDNVGGLSNTQYAALKRVYDNCVLQVAQSTAYFPQMARVIYDLYVPFGKTPWPSTLDGTIMPTSYAPTIQINIPADNAVYPWYAEYTTSGRVTIQFTTADMPLQNIAINVHRMLITNIDVFRADQSLLPIDYVNLNFDYQKGVLYIPVLADDFGNQASYSMDISWQGFVAPSFSEGVTTNNGVIEYSKLRSTLLFTDLEGGPSCRSFIPSFDTPELKATWSTTIIHPSSLVALSNTQSMPTDSFLIDQQPGYSGYSTTTFGETPVMSSYLVAVAVGQFSSMQGSTSMSQIPVRVWTFNGMEIYGKLALRTAIDTINYLEQWTNLNYPINKLDILALPQYTQQASAMENWGLIIGDINALFLDETFATAKQRLDVVNVVAAACSFQFFGNLVTMDNWNDIFLNRGLAAHFSTKSLASMRLDQPDIYDYIHIRRQQQSLANDDNMAIAQPVIGNVNTTNIFGYQSFSKAASLLHMLNNVMGEDAFKIGITEYLTLFEFENAGPTDLWQRLNTGAQQKNIPDIHNTPNSFLDVNSVMVPFTTQIGYPILNIDSTDRYFPFSETPSLDVSKAPITPSKYLWTVPVTTFAQDGSIAQNWFDPTYFYNQYWNTQDNVNGKIQNYGGNSYMRVKYDDQSWKLLTLMLGNKSAFITPITKASIIYDTLDQIRRQQVTWARFFDLTTTLNFETSHIVFDAYKQGFDLLQEQLKMSPIYSKYRTQILSSIENIYIHYGWIYSNNWVQTTGNSYITELACFHQDKDCLASASTSFNAFISACAGEISTTSECNSVPMDFRKVQYCYGVAQNSAASLQLLNTYLMVQSTSFYFDRDVSNLLHGLGCVTDATQLDNMFKLTIQGVIDVRLFERIAKNDDSGLVLYNWAITNGKMIANSYFFSNFVKAMTYGWNSADLLTKLTGLSWGGQVLSDGQQAFVNSTVTYINSNIQFYETNGGSISNWLNSV